MVPERHSIFLQSHYSISAIDLGVADHRCSAFHIRIRKREGAETSNLVTLVVVFIYLMIRLLLASRPQGPVLAMLGPAGTEQGHMFIPSKQDRLAELHLVLYLYTFGNTVYVQRPSYSRS